MAKKDLEQAVKNKSIHKSVTPSTKAVSQEQNTKINKIEKETDKASEKTVEKKAGRKDSDEKIARKVKESEKAGTLKKEQKTARKESPSKPDKTSKAKEISESEKTEKTPKNKGKTSSSLTNKNARKRMNQNRKNRHVSPATEKREDETDFETQGLKDRIDYLRNLNSKGGNATGNEQSTKANNIDIENLEDDVLLERPTPRTMAATLYPIKDILDGMIITNDGRYIRIMEVKPINFQLKNAIEQEAVTNAFCSFLRVAPDNIQLKSVAKKTDISYFTNQMEKDYQREQNANCRAMIKDGEDFLRQMGAADSVTRRYFCIIEVPSEYTKTDNVLRIRDRSLSLCRTCESYLSNCGNKVVEGYDNSETVVKMLFDILNREKSAQVDFDEQFGEVYDYYINNYGPKAKNLIPYGDIITPYQVDMRGPDYIKLGDADGIDNTYYGFFYVKGDTLPNRVYSGWVTNFTNMGEGIDVDIFIEKQKRSTQQERIRRNLLWKKHDISGMSDTSQDYDDIAGALNSGYYLKQGLSSGNEFYFTSFLITVTAGDLKTLKKKMELVKDYLHSQSIEVGSLRYEMDRAFQSYLPLCSLDRKIYKRARRNVLTTDLASYYPFTSSEICDPDGILLGENEMSGSICHADFFDTSQYKNANIAILGCAGAGKSYLLQTMALRFRKKGIQVFILAPDKGHEFRRSCEAIGGQFIRISPGGKQTVNILELRPRDSRASDLLDGVVEDESELAMKMQVIHNFFKLLIPSLTPEEDQILDDAMIKAYGKKGITLDNESLWDPNNPGQYKEMPILGDIYAEILGNPEAKRLSGQMKQFVTGGSSSFNHQTNVDLDNLFTVIDVSGLKGDLLSAGMFAMLDMAYSKAKEDRTKRKVIFIDEAWEIIGSKSNAAAANQVLEMFKIIRGYGGSAVCATQDVNDFFALEDGKYGKGIINNCKTKIVLNLEKKEADTVKELLDLSMDEYKKILQFEKGHALLSASGNNVPIHIMASELENSLITTDRRELEMIANQRAEQDAG